MYEPRTDADDTITSKGYECTRIFTAALRTGWKGLRMYKALVALNRKMVFPLFSTMKVCGRGRQLSSYSP